MRWLAVAVGAAIGLVAPAAAQAQQAPLFRARAVIVSGGVFLTRGYAVGDVTATLRRNALGVPPPFTLVQADSEMAGGVGIEGRLGLALTPTLVIEAGGAYGKPELAVTLSGDPEHAAAAVASERIQQWVIDVSALYQLPISFGRRARPYVLGGGGYLRQLHEGRLLAETGQTIHVGGGLIYWLRPPAAKGRSLGARAEARYLRRSGGVEFNDRARMYPAVSMLVFAGL